VRIDVPMDNKEPDDGYVVLKEPDGSWTIVRYGTFINGGFANSDEALPQLAAYRAKDEATTSPTMDI
jgi:hypothetical protein